MRRHAVIRNDDSHSWTQAQLVAIALQMIEVAAVVALAGVAWGISHQLASSQERIVRAIERLYTLVEMAEEKATEALK